MRGRTANPPPAGPAMNCRRKPVNCRQEPSNCSRERLPNDLAVYVAPMISHLGRPISNSAACPQYNR
jgi:hypothetical protein